VEVEYKDGFEEIFPVSGPVGTSIGFRLKSSSEDIIVVSAARLG